MGVARYRPPRRPPRARERQGEPRLRPVTATSADGHTWDGLLLTPSGADPTRRRLGVMVVHGSVGNYMSGVPRHVGMGLAKAGFSVLTVNTRMANFGVFFGGGLFHRTPLDLDAWLGLLGRLGHARVVLLGYSLGATMVTHYQALRSDPRIVGVLTLAHPRSLPEALQRRWRRFGAEPDYATVMGRAHEVIGESLEDDGGDDEIFVVERASGPTLAPNHAEIWTYRTWWHSRGPQAHSAISAGQIGSLRVPVGLIQAADDAIVSQSDGEELAALARESAVPHVHHEQILYANHVFSGREAVVVERCVAWLDDLNAAR